MKRNYEGAHRTVNGYNPDKVIGVAVHDDCTVVGYVPMRQSELRAKQNEANARARSHSSWVDKILYKK